MSDGALRVLVTGFEPFGGEPVNPSQQLVESLDAGPRLHPRLALVGRVLPVDRATIAAAVSAALDEGPFDAVVALGQATGRDAIDLETRAFNAIDFRGGRDNAGNEARGEPLTDAGPPELSSTLPLQELCAHLTGDGHPVRLSRDAGRHLCNALLYELLCHHGDTPAAFVHIPLLPEQAARRGLGEPSLDADVTRAGVEALLRRLPECLAGRDGRGAV